MERIMSFFNCVMKYVLHISEFNIIPCSNILCMLKNRCALTFEQALTHTGIHSSFHTSRFPSKTLNHLNDFDIFMLFSWAYVCVPACDCDPRGIATQQCDKMSGECVCVEGVSGRRCDSCGRGYVGTFPECEPCHKCFRDWDTNVGELTNQTQRLMDTVEELKDTGAMSPYKGTISSLDDGIKQLRQILDDDKIHQTLKHTQSLRQQAKYVWNIYRHTNLYCPHFILQYVHISTSYFFTSRVSEMSPHLRRSMDRSVSDLEQISADQQKAMENLNRLTEEAQNLHETSRDTEQQVLNVKHSDPRGEQDTHTDETHVYSYRNC